MTRQLIVTEGKDRGRTLALPDDGVVVLGRDVGSDTRLNDLSVSRRHCEVRVAGGKVRINDCNSTGGTFVNDQPIATFELEPGDVIRIGETELRFEDDSIALLKTRLAVRPAREDLGLVGAPAAARAAAAPPVRPTPTPSPAATPAPPREPLTELIGTLLAPFEVVQGLRRGPSGAVFRARDTRNNRAVALKVLGPEFTRGADDMQRLQAALEPVMALSHPGLAALYGVGRTGNYCWLAMELIEGDNLEQVIRRSGPFSVIDWQQALRVAQTLAQALDHLHQRGLIHGHVRPAKVLVGGSDKLPRLSPPLPPATLKSVLGQPGFRPGERLDVLPYLPPEQIYDRSQGDHRSDLYSLGATLYHLLTGQLPFKGQSTGELVAQVLQAEPIPPRVLQPSVPEMLERVVLRLLAKKPQDRYQNAADLLIDLERAARGQAPSGRRDVGRPAGGEKTIQVVCDCGQELIAREKYAGARVRCPNCKSFVSLPGRPALAVPTGLAGPDGRDDEEEDYDEEGEPRTEILPGWWQQQRTPWVAIGAGVAAALLVLALLGALAYFLWGGKLSGETGTPPAPAGAAQE